MTKTETNNSCRLNGYAENSQHVKQEYISRNRDSVNSAYQSANIPLLLFDLILLPIIIIRMVLIYFWGSKYNLKGFQFLDVIMHADNPYFNQEDCRLIDTIGKDYRVVVRDDSRLFPLDLVSYVKVEREREKHVSGIPTKSTNQVIIGTTVNKIPSIWEISGDEIVDEGSVTQDDKISANKEKVAHIINATKNEKTSSKKKRKPKNDSDTDSEGFDEKESDDTDSIDSDGSDSEEIDESTISETDGKNTKHHDEINVRVDLKNPLTVVSRPEGLLRRPEELLRRPEGLLRRPEGLPHRHKSKRSEIKGVNYFESNDDGTVTTKRDAKKQYDILDSIKEELFSAFDP